MLLFCPKSAYGEFQRDERRERQRGNTQRQTERPRYASPHMSREQAYSILGLSPNASREEINAAWKRLMRRMHPDTGGTDGMAMLLNEAREVLLKRAA